MAAAPRAIGHTASRNGDGRNHQGDGKPGEQPDDGGARQGGPPESPAQRRTWMCSELGVARVGGRVKDGGGDGSGHVEGDARQDRGVWDSAVMFRPVVMTP